MENDIVPQNESEDVGITEIFNRWIKAITQPSVETYQEIGFSASESTGKDYLTVFVTALVQTVVISVALTLFQSLYNFSGLSEFGGPENIAAAGGSLFGLLCSAPISGGIVTLGFAIGTGLTHWVANLLGGEGQHEHLLHARASYIAPMYLLTGILSIIPVVNLLVLALGIYILVLHVISAKAIYDNEWWQAAVAGLTPAAIGFGLTLCCIGSMFALIIAASSQ